MMNEKRKFSKIQFNIQIGQEIINNRGYARLFHGKNCYQKQRKKFLLSYETKILTLFYFIFVKMIEFRKKRVVESRNEQNKETKTQNS